MRDVSFALTHSALSLPLHGHVGDRVIPIIEITNEMLDRMDLQDGNLDEWEELMGTPALTPVDFWLAYASGSEQVNVKYDDPSDLDFRIWLGWHDTLERIYVGAIFVDDDYVNGTAEDINFHVSDSMSLFVDSDHGGGRISRGNGDYPAPVYNAIAQVPEGPMVQLFGSSLGNWSDWVNRPPYADGGGAVFGESPTIWVVEFYVTAFDPLIAQDVDESIMADLASGDVIGLNIWIVDEDHENGFRYSASQELDDDGNWLQADGFVDALLIGATDRPTDGSAVMSDSWGRIKASLSD